MGLLISKDTTIEPVRQAELCLAEEDFDLDEALLYQKLEEGSSQIRLVTITPGDWGDDIECTLRTTTLGGNEIYEALSYVWGDKNITKPIFLNERPFEVTVNLESALRHLRTAWPRTFWIDAICVNQQDLPERGSQVRQMTRIYIQATRTIVWLGGETAESRVAFEFLGKLESFDGISETADDVLISPLEMKEWEFALAPPGSTSDDPSVRQGVNAFINDVVSREWWSRVWVLQEAAVSNDLRLKCGKDECQWRFVAKLAHVLIYGIHDDNTRASLHLRFQPTLLHRVMNISMLRTILRKRGITLPAAVLVAWNRMLHATDPKDKVYALSGISSDRHEPLLQPDYDTGTPLVVFRNLVEHFVSKYKSLDLICLAQTNNTSPNATWPSWVPDFASSTQSGLPGSVTGDVYNDSTSSLISLLTYPLLKDVEEGKLTSCQFDASVFDASRVSFTRSPDTLKAIGFCFDMIWKISEAFELGDPEYQNFDFRRWEIFIRKNYGGVGLYGSSKGAVSLTDITERFAKIDIYRNGYRPSLRQESKLTWNRMILPVNKVKYIGGGNVPAAYLRTLTTDRDIHGHRISETLLDSLWDDQLDVLQMQLNLKDLIKREAYNRQLMVSARRYMGRVPRSAQVGDLICVLFGCSVPVILRKVEEHYTLIGESYVQGIMDGEAIEEYNRGELQEQELCLR